MCRIPILKVPLFTNVKNKHESFVNVASYLGEPLFTS